MASTGPDRAMHRPSAESHIPDMSWSAWRKGITNVALFAVAVGVGSVVAMESAARWRNDAPATSPNETDVKKQQVASLLSIAADTEKFCREAKDTNPHQFITDKPGVYDIQGKHDRLVFTGNYLDVVMSSKTRVDELYVCGAEARVGVAGSIGKLGVIGAKNNLTVGTPGSIGEVYQACDSATAYVAGRTGTYMLSGKGSVAEIDGTIGSGIIDGRDQPENFLKQTGGFITDTTIYQPQA